MLMSKAIITLAASASLMGSNPAQSNTHALTVNNPNTQERVYVIQGPNLNANEINSMLENYLNSMGKNMAQYHISQIDVKQPVQKATNQLVKEKRPVHLAVPAAAHKLARKEGEKPAYQQPTVTKTPVQAQKQPVQAALKPVEQQAVTPKPVAQQVVTPKPAAQQAVAQKPVAQQAVTPKPAAQQPVTPKPVAQQPTQVNPPQTTQTASILSAYEQQVFNLTNQERAKYGLPALKVDPTLSKMAHEKSRDMSVNNYFSHTSPTYGSPFDMMKKFGITYSSAGENIAMGQKTPQEVVTAWMNSPGHRQNILDPNYTYIGVGYVAQGNYWTQDFIGK